MSRRDGVLSYREEYLAAQLAAEMRPGQPTQKLRTRDVEEIIRQHGRIGETGVALSLGKAGNRRRTHRFNTHRKPKKKSRARRRSNRRRSNRRRQKKKKTRSN